MAYTLGVIENAIEQLRIRIESYTATGKTLADIKSVVVGARHIESGTNVYPRIVINSDNGQGESFTMAHSGGQDLFTVNLEIRIIAEKLMDDTNAKFSNNVLFDSNGKGIIAYFQWLVDALVFDSDSNYSPKLGLQLNKKPELGFSWDETPKTVEIFGTLSFTLKYTYGTFGGKVT